MIDKTIKLLQFLIIVIINIMIHQRMNIVYLAIIV